MKTRFQFTARFVFETDVTDLNQVKDLAKNYTDEAFGKCKELEADLFSVDFLDDMKIIEKSQPVSLPEPARR